jgi:DNA repair photolyase
MIERSTMNGKPVYEITAKTVLNMNSAFSHKLLCDGPTFSTGSACAYSCSFCYVPDLMARSPHRISGQRHEDVVIRRKSAVETLRDQLTKPNGSPRYLDSHDTRVVYSSPLVDVAANMDLVRETIEACRVILELTNWQIRLLSKSNLLPKIAEALASDRDRMIYGVSTGTLDDGIARAFEQGAPLVSKRISSLHWLQDNGYRTYGMVCPSLPHRGYRKFAEDMLTALRADRCEHVWGEVINVRGESMVRTVKALSDAGFKDSADLLTQVSTDKAKWESYARKTFEAFSDLIPLGKYRFLQYTVKATEDWWRSNIDRGAVLL